MHQHRNNQTVQQIGRKGGEIVQVTITGEAKEIAALVQELQERRDMGSAFVPETADGPCINCTAVEKDR